MIAKGERPLVKMVIGVAHESNEQNGSSEDFMALDAHDWNEEDQEKALKLKDEYTQLGLMGRRDHVVCSFRRTDSPSIRKMKGKDRNKPCPCGSGKKCKKCCGIIH